MNKLFSVFGLMIMATSIPTFAQNVGVGYKSDGSDVSGDFAEAEGDGASVSADVTVGFKIGKKIAIALKQPDGSFTTNPIFHPSTGEFKPDLLENPIYFLNELNKTPNPSWPNIGSNFLLTVGGIYSNTDVSITVTPGAAFVNENDPTSIVKPYNHFHMRTAHGWTGTSICSNHDDNNSSTTAFPYTTNIGVNEFASNGGTLAMRYYSYFYLDTIDATDRSGNYYNSVTFTVTAL